ncbi:TetR/AcrR family transcriptional regulator [Nocardia sp. alder85J]|uniref:TetR/AcrR family transcriptional regulator n=1 Tax=Nocardia sp. alder85J TaxID=2862949 RepID=UPI001CD797D1|nr:TetR/AcrR family transcriptional regulator [Nocardia sp. alder85J]MCX4096809.1 TetR/AcrR family transcriptional regulator [Nocardia sp. alder85J]
MTASVAPANRSAKQQLILTAERLFAVHGLDGVPLRRIGSEAGMANKSAVHYHFGSKEGLIEAILTSRLDDLTRRRALLVARTPPADLRRVVEAHQLPLIELAEDRDCYYLPFLEQLLHDVRLLGRFPEAHQQMERDYYARAGALLPDIPQPLRDLRIQQASSVCVYLSASRHRMRTLDLSVPPYAFHVSQLLDALVAQLCAPPSSETLDTLDTVHPSSTDRPTLRALP